MLSSSVTLTFQAAHGHALRQLPLHADVQDQGGQHHQHQTCIHRAVLGGALLRLHQVQKTYRQGAGRLGGTHQGHGDDILVPEGQEVEQDDGDDGGLCHGEDDAGHGGEVACTVDVGSLLKIVGQGGKIARQQIDGKRQGCGCIHHRQHHQIVQQEAAAKVALQPDISVPQHQEDGHHDVVDIDEQACHKQGVQQFTALEPEAGQAVGGRQRNDQQQHQRQCGHDDRVEHILAHLGSVPRIDKVLPVEPGRQRPRVAVKLRVLLDGGHEYPCHRHDDDHRQQDQHKIDKELVETFRRAGRSFGGILHLLPSLEFQRIAVGGLVDTGGQCKREQEDDHANGHAVAIQVS